jgi:hypothetical protein
VRWKYRFTGYGWKGIQFFPIEPLKKKKALQHYFEGIEMFYRNLK